MKLYRVPAMAAFALVAIVAACGADGGANTAAKVGSNELSVTKLAEVINSSQAPLEPEVARSIAELWVNYQLAGLAAARGDTLNTPGEMDGGLWSAIDNMRVKTLYDEVSKAWNVASEKTDAQRYDEGELLAARHFLIQVSQDATPEAVEAARKKAENLRAQATPANFADLARKNSDEPGASESGGDLGLFRKGAMVPEFETAVLALRPGEISPVIRTSYGFHAVYRRPFSEIASDLTEQMRQRDLVIAESLYLAKMETEAGVKLTNNAAGSTKDIARNVLGFRKDNSAIAEYRGGKLTTSRLADWVAAYPPQAQLRPQLISAPDSIADRFVRQIVRNELLLKMADSAGIKVDSAELGNLRMAFRNNLTSAWTTMGVEPSTLSDSAKTPGARETLVGARITEYFDKLVKNEAQFADVAYPVARALQTKYAFSFNETGLARAIEAARQLRAAADSGAPAAGAPPAGAPVGEPGGALPPTP